MTSRGRRTGLVFALLALAVVTMVVFEATITRVIGVLALFGFVVAGAFAIADHEFLDPECDVDADDTKSAHDDAAAGSSRGQER
ncbi:MAG TPA: hypothetical protein VGV67_13105 [Solirubrobacteraceae bacterium]|nr:hypothetical protein [Solirubrobacteraceae bacterium]